MALNRAAARRVTASGDHDAMSAGRNPHVAKAEAAADRETDAKRRVTYTANADRASADDLQATALADEDSPSALTN